MVSGKHSYLLFIFNCCLLTLVVPTRLIVQLQRERYLARQAVLQRANEFSSSASHSNSPPNNNATVAPAQMTLRRRSSTDGNDSEAVAYQYGQDAARKLDLSPSNALKVCARDLGARLAGWPAGRLAERLRVISAYVLKSQTTIIIVDP